MEEPEKQGEGRKELNLASQDYLMALSGILILSFFITIAVRLIFMMPNTLLKGVALITYLTIMTGFLKNLNKIGQHYIEEKKPL